MPSRVTYTVRRDPKPNVRGAALEAARLVQVEAQAYPPAPSGSTYARTGALQGSVEMNELAPGHTQTTASMFYAGWVYKTGTGLFGPRGAPIVPKSAKMLSWVGASGTRYFAKSVSGFAAWPNLKRAFEKLADKAKWIGWLWPARGL